MSVLFNSFVKMDKWEQAAFLPYLLSPIMLTFLLILLAVLDSSSTAFYVLIPVVLLSYFTFIQIIRKKFGTDNNHFMISGAFFLYTAFFPLFMAESGLTVLEFAYIYLIFLIPTFIGHVYSVIFQLTSSLSNEKVLVIQEPNSSTAEN